MQLRLMYMIIAVLVALVAALAGSFLTVAEGGRRTAAFKAGALTFAGSLSLLIVVMGALGVVGP
ncbi:hypothetical protein ADK52_28695 [Streptomyces sp. WM6372]|uniref:hypothetical protein n=1 Tax=Streptomyces sp. WM6372 TaxID=1415555 RepID=UPI0006AEC33C|nr:hypothetical protein [Streptomyces sp. WM6372]KOU19484.1 hypothetical protein ADK52_28695 [Streptomyces sp. WM6372]